MISHVDSTATEVRSASKNREKQHRNRLRDHIPSRVVRDVYSWCLFLGKQNDSWMFAGPLYLVEQGICSRASAYRAFVWLTSHHWFLKETRSYKGRQTEGHLVLSNEQWAEEYCSVCSLPETETNLLASEDETASAQNKTGSYPKETRNDQDETAKTSPDPVSLKKVKNLNEETPSNSPRNGFTEHENESADRGRRKKRADASDRTNLSRKNRKPKNNPVLCQDGYFVSRLSKLGLDLKLRAGVLFGDKRAEAQELAGYMRGALRLFGEEGETFECQFADPMNMELGFFAALEQIHRDSPNDSDPKADRELVNALCRANGIEISPINESGSSAQSSKSTVPDWMDLAINGGRADSFLAADCVFLFPLLDLGIDPRTKAWALLSDGRPKAKELGRDMLLKLFEIGQLVEYFFTSVEELELGFIAALIRNYHSSCEGLNIKSDAAAWCFRELVKADCQAVALFKVGWPDGF